MVLNMRFNLKVVLSIFSMCLAILGLGLAIWGFDLDRKDAVSTSDGQKKIVSEIADAKKEIVAVLGDLVVNQTGDVITIKLRNESGNLAPGDVVQFLNDGVNPSIIHELIGWISDPHPVVTQIDIEEAVGSNQFNCSGTLNLAT